MAEQIAGYLLRVAATTLIQLFTLFGPGLILVALISALARFVTRLSYVVIGRYFYLLLFGWLGTTVHETGHLLFAMVFGHQIVKFQPFSPDPKTGMLGQVQTGYSRNSIYQQIGNFFVGIAPVLFGTAMIFAALLILFQAEMVDLLQRVSALAESEIAPGPQALLYQTLAYSAAILAFIFSPAHLADWRFYLFLYLTFAIGSSVRLSGPDIKGATEGFIPIIVLAALFNLATLWQSGLAAGSYDLLSQAYAFFYVILALALVLNLLAALILLLPALVLSRR
jgi:hypothetical protein